MSAAQRSPVVSRRHVIAGLAVLSAVRVVPGSAQDATPSPLGPERPTVAVRISTLVEGFTQEERTRLVEETFLPILETIPGLVSYYAVNLTDPTLVMSISVFQSAEGAEASTKASADWKAALPENPYVGSPIVINGEVAFHDNAVERSMMATPAAAAATDFGHLTLRIHDTAEEVDEAALGSQVEAGFLSILQEAPGYHAYYWFVVSESQIGAISIFDLAEQTAASNEAAADWVSANIKGQATLVDTLEGPIGLLVVGDGSAATPAA